MWKYGIIIGAALASAFGAAQAVVSLDRSRYDPETEAAAQPTAAQAQTPPIAPAVVAQPAPATGAAARIEKSPDGHYWAQARVNNRDVRFLVDTGATAVALSLDDARRLGFSPGGLTYGYKVMTANGEARAARVTLKSISVGPAKVRDVEAFVIENGLDASLLGMTYLGRLESFEATRTALILQP